MASFSAGTTFTDGVANDVTAAKLAALVNAATPTSGLIQDRTAETTIAVNDTLLVGDASDSNNLKRMTVANFAGTLPTATITSGTITNLASTTGTIATLNSTTGTIATLNSTTGTIATLNSTTGTIATLNSTTGTITTGVIPTLTSITKITSGTGTAAAPAISPTGDTNTGIFFPTADTIAFSEGGAEAMRIDSSGNVGIGTGGTTAASKLDVYGLGNFQGLEVGKSGSTGNRNAGIDFTGDDTYTDYGFRIIRQNTGANADTYLTNRGTGNVIVESAEAGQVLFNTNSTIRLTVNSSGNVGIGTTSPSAKLNVYDPTSAIFSLQGDSTTQVISNRASTDTTGPQVTLRKSRGSIASPTAVATSDVIGDLSFQAFGGTTNRNLSRIRASVEAYVSDSDISSNLTFLTSPAGGVTPTEKLRIASAGQIGIGGANYGTSGQVLTSGGSASAPSWTTISVTPGTSSITFPMLSTSATEADNAAKRVARAWVNFNGTGTIAIQASLNVSSITDTGTGEYTINFTVAMSDANYITLYTGGPATSFDTRAFHNISDLFTITTSAVRIYTMDAAAALRDAAINNVIVFR